MAESIGQIGLDLVVNQNQFNKQMQGITGLAKKAGAALAAAFAVKKIVEFGKSCTKLGSDLQEVQNIVDVAFPNMTKRMDEFAKGASTSFGLSETMAKRYSAMFGTMARQFGFSQEAAYDMGTTLAGLAGDVASFYDMTQDEAYTKLKAVFSGETEVLKDIGVVMTQNALDAYAMANGYGKTTQAMSEAEKVALRYAFVQQQLSAASGDFIRTSDSWANQVRVLKLNFDSLKATLGQGLINVLTPVLKVINSLLAKLMSLASAFKSFTELITGNKAKGGSGIGALNTEVADAGSGIENAAGASDNLAGSTAGVGKAAQKAAKDVRSLAGFDKITKISEPTDSPDSGSGGSGEGSSGAGGIGSTDFGSLAEGDTVIDELDSKFVKMFENIKKAVQPTIDSLKRLWNEGLARLADFGGTALKDFYRDVLVPIGEWAFGEGFPRFVDALNNGLMGVDFESINAALRELWKALTPFAITIGEGLLWFWENVLVPLGTWVANEVVPRFLETLTNVISILNNVLIALKPLFQWFWDNVLQPIASWAGGVFLTIWDGINVALKKFGDWCAEHPTAIQNIAIIIGAFFAAWKITQFVSAAAGLITTIVNIIGSIKSISGAISIVKYGLSMLVGSFNPVVIAIGAVIAAGILLWKNWDEIKEAANKLKELIVEKFNALKEDAAKAIETFKEKMSAIWNDIKVIFHAFGSYVSGVFSKDWSKSFGVFGMVLNSFFATASNIWDSIKRVFSGIIDFIAGVFTGNWRRAWDGVKSIFSEVWRAFANIVKAPINTILGFINSLLRGVQSMVRGIASALNSISIDLPGWLQKLTGYSSVGFNVPYWSAPQIPYLANGGFVKANTPQLAMIGDNRHQGEIVAPEDKMQDMVNKAVRSAAGTGRISKAELESIINNAVMRIIAALSQMGFFVDGQLMAKAMIKATEELRYRENPVEII